MLKGFPHPPVVRRIRVLPHEGVVHGVHAFEDLPVNVSLVVVPDAGARSGVYGLDGQQVAHPLWFEDPALGVGQGQAVAPEQESRAQVVRAEVVMQFLQSPHMLKGLCPDQRVVQIRVCHLCSFMQPLGGEPSARHRAESRSPQPPRADARRVPAASHAGW